MHSKFIVLVFCTGLVMLTNGPQRVQADFIDDIPILSQIKSFFQGQKRTKEADRNVFKQVGRIIAVVGEKLADKFDGRDEIPESFYEEIFEPILDYTPIVGHLKAVIHAEMGDNWKGRKTWDKANTLIELSMKFAASLFKIIKKNWY